MSGGDIGGDEARAGVIYVARAVAAADKEESADQRGYLASSLCHDRAFDVSERKPRAGDGTGLRIRVRRGCNTHEQRVKLLS